MNSDDPIRTAELLERKIARASTAQRMELQPQLSVVLRRLEQQGYKVPARLRRLDAILFDEAIEARFDNMPV